MVKKDKRVAQGVGERKGTTALISSIGSPGSTACIPRPSLSLAPVQYHRNRVRDYVHHPIRSRSAYCQVGGNHSEYPLLKLYSKNPSIVYQYLHGQPLA